MTIFVSSSTPLSVAVKDYASLASATAQVIVQKPMNYAAY